MKFKKVLIFLLVLVCIPCIFLFVGCGEDKKIKVRVFDNYVQWSYEGEDSWYNAISVDEIKQTLGETYKGDAGINGKQVEFRTTADYIQWHYVGDSDWQNLIAISELKSTDTSTSADNNPQGLAFYPLDDGTYGVGVGFANRLSNIVIPSSYNGKPVTTIVKFGFANEDYSDVRCCNLISITLPNTITTIDDYAFRYCSSLTSISIPSSVTSIGDNAFCGCSLTSISIPSGVTSIGSHTFAGCSSLTSISISSGVTSIGAYAFSYCSSLTSISIPSSVTSIDNYAFSDCSSLTSINIPSSVTSIGIYAFNGCSSLTYNEYNNGLYLGDSNNKYLVFIKPNSKGITDCIISQTCKFICTSAFNGCSSLTSISIPSSVTSIGSYAFDSCRNLVSINIPNSVTYIGYFAFRACSESLKIYSEATSKPSGWDETFISRTYWYSKNQPTQKGQFWHYENGKIVEW